MDRPCKIGLFSPYDHAYSGGVQSHIRELADQFRMWGHTVRIVAPSSSPLPDDDPDFVPMGRAVPLRSADSIARVSLSVWLDPQIKSLLQREQFDIVHMHEPLVGYRRRRVWWAIGPDRLANRLLNRLHGRIAVSNPAAHFVNSHFPSDYRIIPNGVRVDDFSDAEPLPELMDGKTNILFLGRLEKRKGLKYLLTAYSRLKWDRPNIRLIVVGGGQMDADCYRIMSERNLQDVLIVGRTSDKMRERYFKSAHIYCSPATGKESFGIVLLEAMAAGAPVVATEIEGYASVVEHGQNGLLVPPKDEEALAQAITAVIDDDNLRQRLVAEGVRTADSFRWERVASRVMDYYDEFVPEQTAAATA
ncbi:Phosphatidyl-myo-inositol mannosyltransferase [Geodia barretti]|uniref:Phosphatidyl-myo-inositol mannosyltransferase n=1 Tax=Geodia barretti TaxID=519541 RepID=A0AA35RCT1_GEOBA|nr:Phosphatidyl-myo-inositol mannosyltransferase [Geodia barretti]